MRNYRFFLPLVIFFFAMASCTEKKKDAGDAQTQEKSEAIDYTEALEGAWTTKDRNRDGQELIVTTIVMDGYIAESFYNVERKEFDHTFGGSWTIDGTTFKINMEFSSSDSTQVGTSREVIFDYQGDTITFEINGITEDYYNYIVEAQSQVFPQTPLFSGPPANIRTNIDNGAIGFFAVYSVKFSSTIATADVVNGGNP